MTRIDNGRTWPELERHDRSPAQKGPVRPEPGRATLDAAHLHLSATDLVLRALTAHSESSFATAVRSYTLVLARSEADSIRAVIVNHRGMAYFALGEVHPSSRQGQGVVGTVASMQPENRDRLLVARE